MFKRLREGIARTRDGLLNKLGRLLGRREPVDASSLEALETALLVADVGVPVTTKIIEAVRLKAGRSDTPLIDLLRTEMAAALAHVEQPLQIPAQLGTPFVILVVGRYLPGSRRGATQNLGRTAWHSRQCPRTWGRPGLGNFRCLLGGGGAWL